MIDMQRSDAYVNSIETAVPSHDLHARYVAYALASMTGDRERRTLERLIGRAQIDHRYSVLPAGTQPSDDEAAAFFDGTSPDTSARMALYERYALPLAERAIARLDPQVLARTTHLVLTSCTGFSAPGLDLAIVERFGLDPHVERTIVGFMGCNAALNALKLARHIVRSEEAASVLVVNLELCSLHLQRPRDVEAALGFLIFADGCAASIVSREPHGIVLDAFDSSVIPQTAGHITWRVGSLGFDMHLSTAVPRSIEDGLAASDASLLARDPTRPDLWAIHPGGRAILDAVSGALALPAGALDRSRAVLRDFGNMSSATIMFVLQRMFGETGATGRALAFGPGMTCESLRFRVAA